MSTPSPYQISAQSVSLKGFLAPIVALGIGLPITLAFGEVQLVDVVAQSVAVASVFVLLPAQFLADRSRPRPGSSMRLLVLLMVITTLISWGTAGVQRGFSLAATLSALNWVALGGMIVVGQVLFGLPQRLKWAMSGWSWVHAVVAAFSLLYLVGRFGSQLISGSSRSPFQVAMNEVLPNWPNGVGLTFAVASCIPFAQLRTAGKERPLIWLQLGLLASGTLATFSRNAWLSSAAALAAIALLRSRPSRTLPRFIVGSALVALVAWQIPSLRTQILATFTPGSSLQVSIIERLAFALEAARIWWTHPLVGIGFGRFEDFASLARLSAGASFSASYVPGSVHNEYLSTLLKGGVICALSFVAILLAGWRLSWRASRSRVERSSISEWGLAGIGMAAALGFGGLGAESFRQVSVSAPFWLLLGGLSVQPVFLQDRAAAVSPRFVPTRGI